MLHAVHDWIVEIVFGLFLSALTAFIGLFSRVSTMEIEQKNKDERARELKDKVELLEKQLIQQDKAIVALTSLNITVADLHTDFKEVTVPLRDLASGLATMKALVEVCNARLVLLEQRVFLDAKARHMS